MSVEMDSIQKTVERLYPLPENWHWREVSTNETPEDNIKVTGSVVTGYMKKGEKKGKRVYAKEKTIYWIRDSQVKETIRNWEIETNICYKCKGTTQELAGFSKENGPKYRECRKCGGTGKPLNTNKPETCPFCGAKEDNLIGYDCGTGYLSERQSPVCKRITDLEEKLKEKTLK